MNYFLLRHTLKKKLKLIVTTLGYKGLTGQEICAQVITELHSRIATHKHLTKEIKSLLRKLAAEGHFREEVIEDYYGGNLFRVFIYFPLSA
jgi:hypothetical protein